MADYDAISKVIRNAIRKEVDKQIDAAYRRGYADGKARIEPTKAEKEQAYNHGLDKAWECAERVSKLKDNERFIIFGNINAVDIFDEYSASEAIEKIKLYEEMQTEKIYKNNKYYNTFPTSKETADEIKAEYDEETRSYTYTVDDDESEITVDQAIYNLKRGYGIPHKHKTLTLAIKALRMMKENSPVIQMQEPKTGHWEYGFAFVDGNYCKCSECKEIIKCTYPMHYCPSCGAKMEVKE